MKIILNVLPIALLVAYSQLIVKWRASKIDDGLLDSNSFIEKVLHFLSDPLLLSAYAAALLASFLWLLVVAKLPLAVAFPIYIGVTFVIVIFGSWIFLSETVSGTQLLAASLILSGIILGVKG